MAHIISTDLANFHDKYFLQAIGPAKYMIKERKSLKQIKQCSND